MIPGHSGYLWRIAFLAVFLTAAPAHAQRLPVLGGLPTLPGVGQVTGDVRSGLGETVRAVDNQVGDFTEARLSRLSDLVRANPRALELDAHGAPVVRGEVMVIDPAPRSIEIALKAGFKTLRTTTLEPLGVEIEVLSPPEGMAARDGLRRLRKLDPAGQYDLDHVYSQSGEGGDLGAGLSASPDAARDAASAQAVVGMLDTGVPTGHPVLATGKIVQQGFAGGVKIAAHGAAVASLMVGKAPGFRGAAPGAQLFVADVYGDGPTGGSADSIVRALAWMARERVPVINVSLVGPANLSLEAAVRAMTARGELIVAPVGNDGPAAPPLYPASYPGVIAVTAVDARDRLLIEAGRAAHIDFAAPGADIVAAKPDGALGKVRGTSFAAPIVSGRLAVLMAQPGSDQASRAVAELAKAAKSPRGASGLGHGVVGDDLANGLRGASN